MSKAKKPSAKLKFSTALFKGSLIHNPVLTQVIGVCIIVKLATTLNNAFSLCVITALLLVLCEALTSLLLKKVPRWIRVAVYVVISAAFLLIFDKLLNIGSALGKSLYLLCVNELIVVRCEKFASKTTLRNSVVDALACSVGFSAVALIVGGLREFITYGALFSSSGAAIVTNAAATPFFAILIIGFMAAIQKAFVMKFFPEEETDTFSLSAVHDKTVLKDPGLGKKKHKKKRIEEDDDSTYDIIRPRYSIEDIEREGGVNND